MLRKCAILLVAVGPLLADDRGLNTAVEKEKAKLTGTWKAVLVEIDGSKSSEQDAGRIVVTFTATKTTTQLDGKVTTQALYTVDLSRSPKHIDFSSATPKKGDKYRMPAIYSLDGDTLKLCCKAGPFKADEPPSRPEKIYAGEGTGNMLVVYKRVKPRVSPQ